MERKLLVETAQSWYEAARDSSCSMGERLLSMENALNHTENKLFETQSQLEKANKQFTNLIESACKTENHVFYRYAELFPNYAWIDIETAINVMESEIKRLRTEISEYRECLQEASDLVDDHLKGEYKFDSFSNQPWKKALSNPAPVDEEKEVLKEALEKIAKLDFDLPGTGEECVACVRIVSDYAMKILKEARSGIEEREK